MRIHLKLIAIITLALPLSLPVGAQEVVQQVGMNGSVNYTQRIITAAGIGMPGGQGGRAGILTAAKYDALRNLLGVINGINVTSETTVENQMMANDVIKTRVEGIAKHYRMVGEERYYSDGSIEVTIEMSLDGPFMEVMLPERMGGGHALASAVDGYAYSGLIIDAAGLGARPALAPRILNEKGEEVYGSSYVSRDWAIKYGMVGYEKDLNTALENDRVASDPLIAKGIKTVGPNRADIIISNADAEKLHSLRENLSFLEKCRVIVIVD
ncbi:LPP20 family lipoprotein [bacterium]|nr:LPP20 family lipoprotein [bacterium]MBU1651303.1 LPP20 family lipoprotein [bacterium]